MHPSITKEQAAAVQNTRMTCLGPRSHQDLAALLKPYLIGKAALGADDERRGPLAELLVTKGITTTDQGLAALFKVGATDAHHAAARLLNAASRPGCGYDFTETVLSNPLDGQERDYVCPRCGVTGSYRAPLFLPDGVEAAVPLAKAAARPKRPKRK
jgi:hypothetical protein